MKARGRKTLAGYSRGNFVTNANDSRKVYFFVGLRGKEKQTFLHD